MDIDFRESNPPPAKRNPRTKSPRLQLKRREDIKYIIYSTQKWTKGKAKEKVDHAVFVDKATYERLLTGIPKLGKHISASQVIEKFKVVGSIARLVLKQLADSGAIKSTEQHSKQGLFTPVAVAAEKVAPTTTTTEK